MEDLILLDDGTWVVDRDDWDWDEYRNNTGRRSRSRASGRSGGRRRFPGRTAGINPGVLRAQPVMPAAQPVQVLRAQPVQPAASQRNNTVSLGGRSWDLSEVIELGVAVLSATAKLPEAPKPTEDANVDQANQVKYTQALAEHAKRAQQVKVIGQLATALLG